MLHFESIFWQTENREAVKEKLQKLGFKFSPSIREPNASSVYFGPESMEFIESGHDLATLKRESKAGSGIVGIALESTNLGDDYKHIVSSGVTPNDVASAAVGEGDAAVPVWYGFGLPSTATPLLGAWVFMNAPHILEKQKSATLPLFHDNTCFGIEALHLRSANPEEDAKQWQTLLNKNMSGLHWNECGKGEGKRFQLGERFLDFINLNSPSNDLPDSGHVMMITLKVTDLERAKAIATKAGAPVIPCHNRDGFVISSKWTGGPALRFVRAFWKRYLPPVNENYPHGRRTDQFRPLGGAHSTTLVEGFTDNWKH